MDNINFKNLLEQGSVELNCTNSLTGKWDDWVSPGDNFQDSLKVERVGQPIADAFYKDCLGARSIRRYNYNNPDQRWLQKLDIDCAIELEAKSLDIFWLNVSEKFRQCDCGDMCLELWSDFEKQKPGWAAGKTPHDGPDMYLYVTPKYFYEVWANRFFEDMMKKITSEWTREKIEETLKSKGRDYQSNCSIPITVCGHDALLIKTWTKFNPQNEWYGVCVCIPWKTLFNEFLLDINMYDRRYNKLNINKIYE